MTEHAPFQGWADSVDGWPIFMPLAILMDLRRIPPIYALYRIPIRRPESIASCRSPLSRYCERRASDRSQRICLRILCGVADSQGGLEMASTLTIGICR